MAKRACTIANLFVIVTLLAFTGCSTMLPPAALEAYDSCQYDKAASILKKKASEADKDVALYQLALFSTSLRAGYWDEAEKASQSALQTMWGYEGQGRGAASLASAEALKIFKGEPFEKAMASVYAGILYFNKGDYDNARASFSKSLLAMAQKKEETRQDFALGYFLQAKVFLKQGDNDNAKIALEKAAKKYPSYKNIFDLDVVRKTNSLFLIEVGQGPAKVRTGPGDSLVGWSRKAYREKYAAVYVNGKEVARPVELVDLTEQAKSKGKTGKDTVQATKGVAREVAAATAVIAADEASRGNKTAGWVALGAGLFALADQSQADIRQWPFLPDLVLVSPLHMNPGKYSISVKYFDSFHQPIPSMGLDWEYTVEDQTDSMFLIPPTRCKVSPWIGGKK